MTDEQLQLAIGELNENIRKLPETEDNMSKDDRRWRQLLSMEKQALLRIKEAKEQQRGSEEIYNSMVYGLLTSWGMKHPFLMRIVLTNFRWNSF